MRSLKQLNRDEYGQDLIEYALLVGFLALLAGTVLPGVSSSMLTIFARLSNKLAQAASL